MRRITDRQRRFFDVPFRSVLLVCILWLGAALPAYAQSANNPSGLPLPRFASIRSAPVNVRVGPGTRYDIAWTYIKPGQPVEIIQEFDTWRRIRDVDGETGWVHQNLLSGRRVALIAPWANGETGLRKDAGDDAPVRAWLGAGFAVNVDQCDTSWCVITAEAPQSGRAYRGFVPQNSLWGVYPDEDFH